MRHYHKFSILEPKKDKDSTYKYYDSISVGRLLAMRKMRTAGYSLADISKNMTEFSVEDYYRTFHKNTQTAKKKLDYQDVYKRQILQSVIDLMVPRIDVYKRQVLTS